jgi:2-polyprenyl-3-methyl-5-hydroxy-6-metoxy-1,4-benzoquinol methylase
MNQEEAYKEGTKDQFVEGIKLGSWTSYSLLNDPKHMCFVLSRYKFVSRMLEGKRDILEVGAGDGFGVPIVAKEAKYILAIDPERRLIESNKERLKAIGNIEFKVHDMSTSSLYVDTGYTKFDGAYSIDVIEHLDKSKEDKFMYNIANSLKYNGIYVMGTPNLSASMYASKVSEVQHINLKDYKSLKNLMSRFYENVLMFSMNDEVVHTGYSNMAHYLFAVGVGVK